MPREPVHRVPSPIAVAPPGAVARGLALPCLALIRVYRWTLSPIIGGQCRFEPTCSRYAQEAYRRFGFWRGSRLTLRRLSRCHPFTPGGLDPVPLRADPDRPRNLSPEDRERPDRAQSGP